MIKYETEIERRWCVKALPQDVQNEMKRYPETRWQIDRGYLGGGVRCTKVLKTHDGSVNAHLVDKQGKGLSRQESLPVNVSLEAFDMLMSATSERIVKTRTVISDKIEIDEFEGDLTGLILVEREFASVQESEKYEVPEWLRQGFEVTLTITNRRLARWLTMGKTLAVILAECGIVL